MFFSVTGSKQQAPSPLKFPWHLAWNVRRSKNEAPACLHRQPPCNHLVTGGFRPKQSPLWNEEEAIERNISSLKKGEKREGCVALRASCLVQHTCMVPKKVPEASPHPPLHFCYKILEKGLTEDRLTLAQRLKSPLLWLVGFGALGPVVRQDYQGERAQTRKAAHSWRARDEEKERIWTQAYPLEAWATDLLP